MRTCMCCDKEFEDKDASVYHPEVYKDCGRNPDTNNCLECGLHLGGIPYKYICGPCINKDLSWINDAIREGLDNR